MYPLSLLLYKTFFHDKVARQNYILIAGQKRVASTLNRLSAMIRSGDIDQGVTNALLNAGVSVDCLSEALFATRKQKWEEARSAHTPTLCASFKCVPVDQRKVGVSYLKIGHFAEMRLPQGIVALPWAEQLLKVQERIELHRREFSSEGNKIARRNYFGRISGYTYRPSLDLDIEMSSKGELIL
jgi:hypothetical protein